MSQKDDLKTKELVDSIKRDLKIVFPEPSFAQKFRNVTVAILLGFLAYNFLALLCGFVYGSFIGMPPVEVAFLVKFIVCFIGGALAGCLIMKRGWLWGICTQPVGIFGLLFYSYILLTRSETTLEMYREFGAFFLMESEGFREIFFMLLGALIGGVVGEKYYKQIREIVGGIFGFIFGGMVIISQLLGGIVYLFFLYLAGKALFEQGNFLKAGLIVFIIGPILSTIFGAIMFGIIMGGGWIFEKLSSWYSIEEDEYLDEEAF